MKFLIIYLLLTFMFMSCARDDYENWHFIGKFPSPIELEGIHVFQSEFGIFHIELYDSLILTSTERDTLFHVYKKDGEYLGGFGNRGNGPLEFPFPTRIQDVISFESKIIALVYNQPRHTLIGIDILATLAENEIIINREYALPNDLKETQLFKFVDIDRIVGVYDARFAHVLDRQSGGFLYYAKSDTFNIFPLYNLKTKSNGEDPAWRIYAEINLNARMLAISPDKNRAAFLLYRTPKLEIIPVESNSVRRYLLHRSPPKHDYDVESIVQMDIIDYHKDLFVTDNYLYMLYSGKMVADEEPHDTFIQVIDWNGKPQRAFLIPSEYNVRIITVDEEKKHIYGFSFSNDAIYRFDYGAT